MHALFSLLNTPVGTAAPVRRAGMATLCRLACAAAEAGRTAVIVTRSRAEFAEARALAALLTPSLSVDDAPLSRPAWESPCLALPPGLGLRADRDAWGSRMAALYGLALRQPRCVIVSLESLLIRQMPPAFFDGHVLELERGSDYAPDLVIEQLVEWGYTRVPMVTHGGELARRGDILDIFPRLCASRASGILRRHGGRAAPF